MRLGRTLAPALLSWLLLAGTALAQPPSPDAPERHLVVPFENVSGEARVYWLSEGSAVLLTDDLLALNVRAITRDDRLRAFDRLRIPNLPALSHATVIRLGQVVGAAQVIVGSFDVQGDELTVRARAIRLDAGLMSPEIVERGPLGNLFDIYARVARRIAPAGAAEPGAPAPASQAAFEQFIKGVLAESPETRVTFLTQALALTPTFQRARLALWEVYTDMESHRQALALVREVPADSRFSRRARFLSAISQMHLGQYADAYDTLLALNEERPDPAILNALGIVQLRRPVNAPGGRASTFFADAAAIDAGDADLVFNLGYAYWLARDAVNAVPWLREAVRRNPADDEAHYILGVALEATGSEAEGAREKDLARRLSSLFTEWEKTQPVTAPVPRGLERLTMDLDVPAALRMENVIVAAGQRDQQQLALLHLESGRRLAAEDLDADAIAELRRAVYLAPYQSEAHLLLGRIYLRTGRPADAIDALKISVWSEDSNAGRIALADAYVAAKEPEAARAELEVVLARDAANAEARRLLDQLP